MPGYGKKKAEEEVMHGNKFKPCLVAQQRLLVKERESVKELSISNG